MDRILDDIDNLLESDSRKEAKRYRDELRGILDHKDKIILHRLKKSNDERLPHSALPHEILSKLLERTKSPLERLKRTIAWNQYDMAKVVLAENFNNGEQGKISINFALFFEYTVHILSLQTSNR